MRKETAREWGEFTKSAMDLAGITQEELAEAVGKKAGRRITQGAVQARINGPKSQPPQDQELEWWADALKLTGFHREKFIRLALFSRTPLSIRQELIRAEDRLAANEVRVKNLERNDSRLRGEVAELRGKLAEVTAQAAELLRRINEH